MHSRPQRIGTQSFATDIVAINRQFYLGRLRDLKSLQISKGRGISTEANVHRIKFCISRGVGQIHGL